MYVGIYSTRGFSDHAAAGRYIKSIVGDGAQDTKRTTMVGSCGDDEIAYLSGIGMRNAGCTCFNAKELIELCDMLFVFCGEDGNYAERLARAADLAGLPCYMYNSSTGEYTSNMLF